MSNEHKSAKERRKFEQWISGAPIEQSIDRWPETSSVAWPGHYKEYKVQLAWEAWCESRNAALDAAAKAAHTISENCWSNMEGEGLEEFKRWENSAIAASEVEKAIIALKDKP